MLNDLFGIQSRGGCSCAGPYGHRLLAIDPERSHAIRDEVGQGCDGIKPGWLRINFNYFVSDTVCDYRALQADRQIGLLLPCNVVVRTDGADTIVETLDPQVMVTVTGRPDLKPVADDAARRLALALTDLQP